MKKLFSIIENDNIIRNSRKGLLVSGSIWILLISTTISLALLSNYEFLVGRWWYIGKAVGAIAGVVMLIFTFSTIFWFSIFTDAIDRKK